MGLDSYLYRVSYESGYKPDARYTQLIDLVQAQDVMVEHGAIVVRVTVAYWRKANAIHQWFVTNCQDGEDDCRTAEVSREHLTELRDLCRDLLVEKDPAQAEDKLPPQEGFLFGSTEINDYYWEDLADTVRQLDRILTHTPEDSGDWFEYHASW